jgi:N-acetylglucosamine-6-phosphate deacetylase
MDKPSKVLIDLQINGFMGVDFSNASLTQEKFAEACRNLFNAGTGIFLPTIITSPLEVYEKNLKIMSKTISENNFGDRIPGFHIEGPFISPEPGFVGAHNSLFTRKPDPDILEKIFEWSDGKIKLLTVAAELDGIEKLINKAVKLGITVSIGHSNFTAELLKKMFDIGVKTLTHFGNGLPHTLAKFANPLWAGLCDDRFTAMFIADGIHIPTAILKKFICVKGIDKVVIVSDASPIAGLPPGSYTVFGKNIVLDETGRIFDPEKGNLAGSSFSIKRCVDFLSAQKFLSQAQIKQITCHNPLKLA